MPSIDPVGRVIHERQIKIVGVLQSVKQVGPTEPTEPDLYAPFAALSFFTQAQLIVRQQKELTPVASATLLRQVRHLAAR